VTHQLDDLADVPRHASPSATWVEVHALLAAYLTAVDAGDFDRVADLLGEAVVVSPAGTVSGRTAIRRAYAQIQPVPHEDGRRRTKHHLTNLLVSGEQEDGTLVAEAYYFVLEAGVDGPRLLRSGRFREVLQRRDGRWSIREHRVLADF